MSVPVVDTDPTVLLDKLIGMGAPERGARLLVQASPDAALDVINGDVCSPRTGPPVGIDGQVLVDYRDDVLEHDPSCHACGGAGHPDGPCGYCATWTRG